jgi:hypothetical protein
MDFGGAQLYYGLELKPERDARDVVLYGNCAIKSSKGLENATRIEGCPPTLTKTLIALMKVLLSRPRMLRMVFVRFIKLIGIRLGIYKEVFPKWERYRSKEFNKKDF